MKLAIIFICIAATTFLLAKGKYLLVQVEDPEDSLKEDKTNVGIPQIPISREGFPNSTDCPDRLAAPATCGADHQCMSQRCSQFTSGKKCALCRGSGALPCNSECDDDDNCCSNDCTCGNDGNNGSGTRCC